MSSKVCVDVVCNKCKKSYNIRRDSFVTSQRRHREKNPDSPFIYECQLCRQNGVEISDDYLYSFIDIDETRKKLGDPKNGKSHVLVRCGVRDPGCLTHSEIQLTTLRFNIRKAKNDFVPKCLNCAFGTFPKFLLDDRLKRWVSFDSNVTLDSTISIQCPTCLEVRNPKVSHFKSAFDRHVTDSDWKPHCVDCANRDEYSATSNEVSKYRDQALAHPDPLRIFLRCAGCGASHDTSIRSLMNSIRSGKISGRKYEYNCFQCSSAGEHYVSLKELQHVILPLETVLKFGQMPTSRRDSVCARCENCEETQYVKLDSVLRSAYVSRRESRSVLYLCLACSFRRPEVVETMARVRNVQQRSEFKSGIESVTARILNSLGLDIEDEYKIGPYNFDFFIPSSNLLIEVQGEYWHSLPKHMKNDRSKATFIQNHHPDKRILYLEERLFLNPNLVRDKILSTLNVDPPSPVDFEFQDLVFRPIEDTEKDTSSKSPIWRDFLNSFHYARAGRAGKIRLGAYLNGHLIAVVKFSSTTRAGTAATLGLSSSQVLELDRLCIHPNFRKKNLASWMISRASSYAFQSPSIRALVSFADPDAGHSGSVYRASNWNFFGKTSPSYEYITPDGTILHKKTVYERARSVGETESVYADSNILRRRRLTRKLKFVLTRP